MKQMKYLKQVKVQKRRRNMSKKGNNKHIRFLKKRTMKKDDKNKQKQKRNAALI